MIEKLFVYGTLCPDRPNEHVLDAIGGSWKSATISGALREEGWGAEMGYPGIDLDGHGREVEGFFSLRKTYQANGRVLIRLKLKLIVVCRQR